MRSMPAAHLQAPRLEVGARVGGKYRLLGRIASGGMGEVWRARNESTEAQVALKVSRSGVAEAMEGRFRREARLAASLSHRNVVRIFDLVENEDGSFVLVMELLRGASLGQYLKTRSGLSTKEAVALALPVLAGLAHVHERGMVHRDVTPANVFLAVDPDGLVTPKLIDFGIAKLPDKDAHTVDGRVLGTPRYMAPEQIRGQTLDGRADLFSLAVVLYEAITGAGPFDAASPSASLAAVLESPVDADPLIEPRVWLELQRALSKRPYERHAGAIEMGEALRTASGETESTLSGLLQQMRPSSDGPGVLEGQGLPGASTVEGQSVERRLGGRIAARTAWRVASVGATCAALVGAAILWRGVPRSADIPPTPPPAAPAVAPPTPVSPAASDPSSAPTETASSPVGDPARCDDAPGSSARSPSPTCSARRHATRVLTPLVRVAPGHPVQTVLAQELAQVVARQVRLAGRRARRCRRCASSALRGTPTRTA